MKRTHRPLLYSAAGLLAAAGMATAGLRGNGDALTKSVRLPDVPSAKDGATTLPNGWQVTPAGRPLPLPGDLPTGMTLTPDGRYLLVNTAGFHDHGVSVIDVAAEKLLQTVDVGKDWGAAALSPAGEVFVSAGGAPNEAYLTKAAKTGLAPVQVEALKQPILSLSLSGSGALTAQSGVEIADLTGKDRWISGLAAGPDGALYATDLQNDTVYKLSGTPRTVQASVKAGRKPTAPALSPDGRTLAVANWGDATVSLLNPATLQETARVPVGSHPITLAWGKDGRLFVVCSGANGVSVVSGGKVKETIKTSLNPRDPVGSTPDAIAVSPDGTRLYVANADNNNVAVIDISDAKESRIAGFIPTGWYPSALAVSTDGKKLFVGTGKGLSFRANANAGTHIASPESLEHYDYIGSCLSGAVSVVDVPDATQLAAYTKQVQANTPSPKTAEAFAPNASAVRKNAFSHIKHVIYIIRENRTYDQVFGDIKTGNGDPNLCLFGEQVTPNAHRLVRDYVLLDNLYCNGEVSEDGHQWCDSAYATDWNERSWTNSYSGRGEPGDAGDLNSSPAGYLWDNCAKHGVSYRTYGEASSFKSSPDSPPIFQGPKALDGHASYAYSQIPWFGKSRDLGRADIFIKDMQEAEKTGDWPRFMVMSLPEDHTEGLKAGALSPTAHVGENDQGLGRIVEAVSHSKFWPQTAIFVIEDDAQNGPDHVDAHRTVGLVLSPYVKRGYVDSTLYSTASMIRTMELILGLPPMTQFDQNATPMYNAFSPSAPVLTAYTALPAGVDLLARNPTKGEGAVASAKLDFSDVDRADPDALNTILWHALKPGKPMPAPVRSARLLAEARPED